MEDHYGQVPGLRNAPSGRGGVLLVSLYSWTCIAIGVAIARYLVAYIHKVQFAFDDVMVLAGTCLYTGATVACQYAVDGGLGKHFVELKPDDTVQFYKAVYAAQLLQIATMGLAKLSSAFLLGRVAPQSRRERGILFGSVGCWVLYSIFALAFQCGLPRPWEFSPQRCGHGGPMVSIIILNMVSDILLTAWIFPILHPLNMDKTRQRTVGILFGSRAVVPLVAIAQIWATLKVVRSEDPTWDGFALALSYQTVTSLSLVVASLPRIKRFIGSSGLSNPRIHEADMPLPNRPRTRSESEPLKLVPSSLNQFTTTVLSESSKKPNKNRVPQDWQKFVLMGSKQDDQNSTSSLFELHGVMLQQEVIVQVEDKSPPGSR